MVFYCPHCKKLYDGSRFNCGICGSLLSFDSVRSRSVFLAEGYEDAFSGVSEEPPAPPEKTVTEKKDAEPPRKKLTSAPPVSTLSEKKAEPPRKKEEVTAPPLRTVTEKKDAEPPRRTEKTPPPAKTVTEKKLAEPPRSGGSNPPVPPPGFIFGGGTPGDGGGSEPPVPPPGFSGGGGQPPRRDDDPGTPPSRPPHPPGGEDRTDHPGDIPTPPPGFGAAGGGRGTMRDPQAPNYGNHVHVHDGGSGGGSERPAWGRILLIILLLALVGFVLYMVLSMRNQIAGKLSNVAFGVIVIAAVLLYLRRRR